MFPVAAPPVEDAIVVVDRGRVTRVGRQAPAGVEVRDLGDVALLPGFVNSHCHLEFSALKRPLGRRGATLPKWVRQVIEKRPTAKTVGKAIASGLEQSLQSGVTTLGEICRTETDSYKTDSPSPRLVLMQESIGFSQARSSSALVAAENRLDELGSLLPNGRANGHSNGYLNGAGSNGSNGHGAGLLNGSNGHTNGHASQDDKFFLGVSPHAPYTASPQLIRELVAVAAARDLPVAIHLAESPEELQLLTEGKGPFQQILEERGMWDPWVIGRGSSPMDYLRMLTKAPRALVVHGNYLDHASLAMMGRHAGAMSLVFCPRTHAFFKHKRYPLVEALELGVPVCLGTDSRASNPDLCLLSEMREVAGRYPEVDPEQILRMGTLAGAEALGVTDVGAIRPGAWADFVTVSLPGAATADSRPGELLARVLADEQPVESVWIGGEELAAMAAV
ncbi:amidohydrolase family protein [Pseudobythopirellula maris]|uniref:amidohydrolase family protein n=1 Tax=Pseudobythopirellula maris TaxID=2527991 RepID=UPI0018D37247|nr:amidohydrolase family protein [Pseudobythopirellula maris]